MTRPRIQPAPPRPTTRDRRKEAQDAVKRLSGKPAGSVSKKTDMVVVGESPGSKFDKARQLGIKTISKKEFLKLIGKR